MPAVKLDIPSSESIEHAFQKADEMYAKVSDATAQLKNNPNMSREMSILLLDQFFGHLTRRQMDVGKEIIELTTRLNNRLISFDLITAERDQFFNLLQEQRRQADNALDAQKAHDDKLRGMLDDLYRARDNGTADEGMKASIKDLEEALGITETEDEPEKPKRRGRPKKEKEE